MNIATGARVEYDDVRLAQAFLNALLSEHGVCVQVVLVAGECVHGARFEAREGCSRDNERYVDLRTQEPALHFGDIRLALRLFNRTMSGVATILAQYELASGRVEALFVVDAEKFERRLGGVGPFDMHRRLTNGVHDVVPRTTLPEIPPWFEIRQWYRPDNLRGEPQEWR